MMFKLKKHIPNFFTLMNIVSGFFAIIFAFQGQLVEAFYFILGAAFFDFIDGGVARLLKVQSEVGKQLDSLCDVVSFGVAPGVILFAIMRDALALPLELSLGALSAGDFFWLLMMALVPSFSALRLAKFNVDTRQTDRFIGLPVPANAMLIASLGALYVSGDILWLDKLLMIPLVLFGLSIVQSYLLVSPLPMFALKFKNLKWKSNQVRFIFLLASLCSLFLLGIGGIALAIIMYILTSLIISLLGR